MPSLVYLEQTYDCATAIKGDDYIHLLDDNGRMVASFDGITDFGKFTLQNGTYTSPTADHNCYVAVMRDDGTIGKGGHTCADISAAMAAAEAAQATADGKADSNHTHTAVEIGARPNTWMPTAADVGALPTNAVPNDIGAYSMNEAVPLVTNDDLNSYTTVGMNYSATIAVAKTIANCPVTEGFTLHVERNAASIAGYCTQRIVTYSNNGGEYIRRYNNGVWKDWEKVLTTGNGGSLIGAGSYVGTVEYSESTSAKGSQTVAFPSNAKAILLYQNSNVSDSFDPQWIVVGCNHMCGAGNFDSSGLNLTITWNGTSATFEGIKRYNNRGPFAKGTTYNYIYIC